MFHIQQTPKAFQKSELVQNTDAKMLIGAKIEILRCFYSSRYIKIMFTLILTSGGSYSHIQAIFLAWFLTDGSSHQSNNQSQTLKSNTVTFEILSYVA